MNGFNARVAGLAMAVLTAIPVGVHAQEGPYPVIFASRVNNADYNYVYQCLMGATTGQGEFVPYEQAESLITKPSSITWYDFAGPTGSGTSYLPEPGDDPCDWARTTGADGVPEVTGTYLGLAGDWPVFPEVLRLHSPQSQTYGAAAADYFASIGHVTSAVTLRQVIRTDFEGDGVEEVVLTITDYAQPGYPSANPGDHSVILLRRVVNGAVETVVVDGEIHDTRQDFAAPLEFEVIAIADVNGDGIAEIIATADYYEGSSVATYDVSGGDPQMVMTCGCGL